MSGKHTNKFMMKFSALLLRYGHMAHNLYERFVQIQYNYSFVLLIYLCRVHIPAIDF